MPVVAVIAAVAAVGTVPGIIAAGTLTVLGAMTAVGAVLGAVGAVTHNKTLGLIGAGIGLVGGIGSLAFGSDALGTVDELFGSAASDTANAAGAASAVGATDSLGVAGGAAPDALGVVGGVAPGELNNITTATGGLNAATLTPQGMINSAMAPAEGSAAGILTGGDAGGALAGSLSTTPVSATTMDPNLFKALTNPQLSSSATEVAGKTGGFWNWAKNNQLLAYGVLQAGGSFISGLTDPLSPAQVGALNAQAAANNAAAGLTQRQIDNMKSGSPTATVTGRVSGGSLINHAPAAASQQVTGQPNMAPLMGSPAASGVPA